MKVTQNYIRQIKRHLSANGSLLLPLALRWRLLYMAVGLFTLLILPDLAGQRVSAATITLEVPSSLSLTLQPDGAFHSQSSATPVKITSDAFAGYDFSIKSSIGSNALTNGAYSIKSIGGATESSAFEPNTWGWQYTKGSAEPGNTFLPGPIEGTKIDHTDEPIEGEAEYTITLGAKVDSSIPYGTYSSSFALMVTANPVPYTITYNQNAEGIVSDVPDAEISGQSATGEVTLSTKEPKRDGFRFLGWCMGKTKKVEGIDTCDDEKTYKPGNNYALTSKGENIELFAMWTSNSQVMQNWGGCKDLAMSTSAENNHQITLVDIRDNRLYYVAKLADGNCWMTENLDLFVKSDPQHPYTPLDTDVKKNWVPKESTHTSGDTIWNSEHKEGAPGEIHPQSYDPGDVCWKGEQTWSSGGSYEATDYATCEEHADTHFHIGNYYNYAAAVAMNDTSNITTDKQAATSSICPAGWQLPAVEGSKSFIELQEATNAAGNNWVAGYIGDKTSGQTTTSESTMQKDPFYFIYGGYWRGRFYYVSRDGDYYSSAVVSSTLAYRLYFNGAGGLIPQISDSWRLDGFNVRCVTRNSMQTVDEWGKDVEKGETVIAFDERDGSTYTVSRLADDKLWMTENLRIGGDTETTLTTTDSDVTKDYTLPASNKTGFDSGNPDANNAYVAINGDSEKAEYGSYYTWFAATAGSGTSSTNSGDAASSICPKGWRLPTGNPGGDFEQLSKAYGEDYSNLSNVDGPNFLLSGYYGGGTSAYDRDKRGLYWSSTAQSSNDVYGLDLSKSNVSAADVGNHKWLGFSVRCVAR